MHNVDFDLMKQVPFSRLALVLSKKGCISSYINGLGLYTMSM